ncbi:hypothetical protein [Rhodalgimonas zhirmunskyi]|uniref:Uncharacterized protein n=1 Tax=Rhodalgimonas zhirmunskyi TaxID=2964767 RepID=A0AAJ1U8I1_9RHOB|nr:hypothetical protein [Rhodoalgimonas zhirmunskyi]MDQ2094730.1 hypothetical protein [Rhodoalgimonas zhirmunskyi]
MPLEILGPMVLLGIVGIGVLLHLMGLSAPHHFACPDDARAAWDNAFPQHPARRATLCADNTAALIDTDAGPGLVWPMGADVAARLLAGAQIEAHGETLSIRLPDFTAPRIRLPLPQEDRATWRDILETPA